MDASALSALQSAGAAAQAQEATRVGVLRKTLDAQQEVALELIQAIKVPGLGENVDLLA